MSLTNTDTGDTVNITTTNVEHNLDNSSLPERQISIQENQDKLEPREALVSLRKVKYERF